MTLPCEQCRAECCGPVPVGTRELDRIIAHLTPGEAARLAGMQRESRDCMFLDTEKWQCAIYAVRPAVCRVFGFTPAFPCPRCPQASGTMSDAEARSKVEYASGTQQLVGFTAEARDLRRDMDTHRLTWNEIQRRAGWQ